jgi:hypothetical protein
LVSTRSHFLTGTEVAGHAILLVIADVKKEVAFSPKTQKKESVLVVYFEEKERGVRLGRNGRERYGTSWGATTRTPGRGKQS